MAMFKNDLPLFLTDGAKTVPVIPGWNWQMPTETTGYLESPDGQRHCSFDLTSSTMVFDPEGEPFEAPGLNLSIVQEMGETYANELVFTPEEQAAYKEHLADRDQTLKERDRQVRNQLKGVIQLQHENGVWIGRVDTEKGEAITGLSLPKTCGKEESVKLFNQMSEAMGARPLRDPSGYMALSGNVYEYLFQEYQNQYEDTAQAIDNQLLDGTGYAVNKVLDSLQSYVRRDMQAVLPEGEFFGNLRFVEATDERKQAIRDFVQCRIDKTLTYEKKRSYEEATLDRTQQKFLTARERLRESLSSIAAPDLGSCLNQLSNTENQQI